MESSLIPSFLKKQKKKRKKKDTTSSLIHKKASPYLLKFYQEIPAIHTLLQAPCLILAFLLFPSHRQLLPSLKSRTPQSHSGRWEIFFQTPVYVDIFTSSHESQMFLVASRVVNFLLQCMKVKSESKVAQSCLTLRDPMDCSLRGGLPSVGSHRVGHD